MVVVLPSERSRGMAVNTGWSAQQLQVGMAGVSATAPQ